MFKVAEKTELNQISLTGIRALIILGLLIKHPRSIDEIKRAFIELKLMKNSAPDDILRIDLNTLKIMGCEISRPTPTSDYKYVLTKHPFELKIDDAELNLLKRLYNKVKHSADIALLIEYHELFKKISEFVFDSEKKERLLGISVLKYYEMSFLKDLIMDCKQKRALTLVYDKPTVKTIGTKEVIAHELVFKNDKVYLHAYDEIKGNVTVLNIKRIKKILVRKLQKSEIDVKPVRVLFNLKEHCKEFLEAAETIVATENGNYIVEGLYYNEFEAFQRVLSLGTNCTVTEPEDFRKSIVEKIKGTRQNYDK